MTHFYFAEAVPSLQRHGTAVPQTGEYAVWVWAQAGSGVALRLNGVDLPPTHVRHGAGTPAQEFCWARAGSVALQADIPFAVELEVMQSGLPERGEMRLGGLALSAHPGFDPRRTAEVTRARMDTPRAVQDARLAAPRGTHAPWNLPEFVQRSAWLERAQWIREHILSCAGLLPLPERTPLRPCRFGRLERPGYAVEKVRFESLPGFHVCGNLYTPAKEGRHPGIASPHGHWKHGRLEDSEAGSVAGRCINLARQGNVVFAYDMVGYVDSTQVDHHGFGGRREDLWGIGALGLQLWNSIRVLDLLETLAEVDPLRLGCTGASGGGTQTFLLTAVDERVKAAAPVNMISAHMQGGCNCENQGHLRLQLSNVEIAACAAPRPLLMVATTGDWTVNTPELEYPAVRRIYQLFGAADEVFCVQQEAPHNYNQQSREAVYSFFARVFHGAAPGTVVAEEAFVLEPEADLRVVGPEGLPAGSLTQNGVIDALIRRRQARLAASRPRDAKALARLRDGAGRALAHALSLTPVSPDQVQAQRMGRSQRRDHSVERLLLFRRGTGECVPAVLYLPRPQPETWDAVLVLHPEGKAALADLTTGGPGMVVQGLLSLGHAVLAMDTFLTGEHGSLCAWRTRDQAVSHFFTYNQATAACRVQDVLTGVAYLQGMRSCRRLHLAAVGGDGVLGLLARAACPGIARVALDCGQLELATDTAWEMDELFIPAVRAAGDIRVALALCAPGDVLLHNIGAHFPTEWGVAAYQAAGAPHRLRCSERALPLGELVEWFSQDSAP
jgi:hypothetical protein